MKTSELSGAALDLAVAQLMGYSNYCSETDRILPPRKEYGWIDLCDLNYSSSWDMAGPIIEREHIALSYDADWAYDHNKVDPDDEPDNGDRWYAEIRSGSHDFVGHYGPTPLVAAMRCFVASRLDDEVEIPEGLK